MPLKTNKGRDETANYTFCQITNVSPDDNSFLSSGFNPNRESTCFMINFGSVPQIYNLIPIPNKKGSGEAIGAGPYKTDNKVSSSAIPFLNNHFYSSKEMDGTTVSSLAHNELSMHKHDYTLYAIFGPIENVNDSQEHKVNIYLIPAKTAPPLKSAMKKPSNH
jgi:hypothetical protein